MLRITLAIATTRMAYSLRKVTNDMTLTAHSEPFCVVVCGVVVPTVSTATACTVKTTRSTFCQSNRQFSAPVAVYRFIDRTRGLQLHFFQQTSETMPTFDPRDLQHEEEIQRNPYDLKIWLAYLTTKRSAPSLSRYVIYERALKFLPRSYKLWHAYLQERTTALNNRGINDKRYGILVNTYERALVNMHKMPRIW